ncbi:MAG: AsmA family protein [Sedimentisphaerales bacterium]|nr:AsmA family protein [Sedimentisphaerales bacterium]
MISGKKILKIALLCLIILVVAAAVIFLTIGSHLLKAGLEKAATQALGVDVDVADIDLSILRGAVGIEGLIIKNPSGYKHENLLELGKGYVSASIGSMLSDTMRVKTIKLDGVNLVIEQKGLTNNLQEVINSISKKEEKQSRPKGKNLQIDQLEISDITVKVKLLPVPGKADTITLKLAPIRMSNLGSDSKMDTAVLSSKIMLALAQGVAKQGAGKLPAEIVDGMKFTLDKALGVGKAVTEEGQKIIDVGKDTGKEIIEGFKGILKPKEKK